MITQREPPSPRAPEPPPPPPPTNPGSLGMAGHAWMYPNKGSSLACYLPFVDIAM